MRNGVRLAWPSIGITAFYLPLILWLINAPYGPRFRAGASPPRRAVRGFDDVVQTARDIAGHSVIVSMTLLAGAASFLVGNAYSAQMPGFAYDLCHGDPGLSYSMLLAADAAGGLLAGIVLEGRGLLPPRARTAIVLAALWSVALAGFALATNYWFALGLLFAAGFFELAFNAMAQTLVQIHAPVDMRGRVIGLFNMASLGLRAFGGVSVGLAGTSIGVHWSLALSALAMLAIVGGTPGCTVAPHSRKTTSTPVSSEVAVDWVVEPGNGCLSAVSQYFQYRTSSRLRQSRTVTPAQKSTIR